jgi:ECF sigma factor
MRWQPDPTFYPSAKVAMEAPAEKVVELRFFGGLSVEETAEVLRILPQSVMCRAWLNGSWTDPANPHILSALFGRAAQYKKAG